LSEGGHGRDGAESGDQAVAAVCKNATLDAGVEEVACYFEAGDIACCGDVANCCPES